MPCRRPRMKGMTGGETRSRAPRLNPLPGWMPAGWWTLLISERSGSALYGSKPQTIGGGSRSQGLLMQSLVKNHSRPVSALVEGNVEYESYILGLIERMAG